MVRRKRRLTSGIRFGGYSPPPGYVKTQSGCTPFVDFYSTTFFICWKNFVFPLSQMQKRRIPRTLNASFAIKF